MAAAAFGFFTLIQPFDGPDQYVASSFFERFRLGEPTNLCAVTGQLVRRKHPPTTITPLTIAISLFRRRVANLICRCRSVAAGEASRLWQINEILPTSLHDPYLVE